MPNDWNISFVYYPYFTPRGSNIWGETGGIPSPSPPHTEKYFPPPTHTQPPTHPPTHTHFCVAARKREAKKKRKGVSNQKPLKGCHQVKMLLFIHSRASRIQTF